MVVAKFKKPNDIFHSREGSKGDDQSEAWALKQPVNWFASI